MKASVLIPLLALFSGHAVCEAGVDYYSGSDSTGAGDAVVVDFASSGAQWAPIPSVTAVGVERDNDGGTIRLDGTEASGGSQTPYNVFMSVDGFGQLNGYVGAAPSENGIGVTVSTGSANDYTYAAGSPGSATGGLIAKIYRSTDGVLASYNGSQSNYFAWHANDLSGLFAIGWARYTVQGTTSLTIEEWAYNLASNTSSIVFGETGVSSGGGDNGGGGTVPEPTGLAIFGLASLGFALRRRR